MRRFQLRPIQLGAGGFQQTLIIPPAAPRQAAQQDAPPSGDCADVEDLPAVKIALAYDTCAGANTWRFAVILQSDPDPTPTQIVFNEVDDALPAGYTLLMPDPADTESVPSTGPIFRACDNTVAVVPAVYVGEYVC